VTSFAHRPYGLVTDPMGAPGGRTGLASLVVVGLLVGQTLLVQVVFDTRW
jgi:hypothetical protein